MLLLCLKAVRARSLHTMEETKNISEDAQQAVWLTGWPGAGKTTMGRHIAERHGWYLCDGDEFIDKDPELTQMIRTDVGTAFNLIND